MISRVMARLRLLPRLQLCLAAFSLLGEKLAHFCGPRSEPRAGEPTPQARASPPPRGQARASRRHPPGRELPAVAAARPSHQLGNKAFVTGLMLSGGISNG